MIYVLSNRAKSMPATMVTAIAAACTVQMVRDFAPAYRRTPSTVLTSMPGAPTDRVAIVSFVDENKDVPGALAWHEEQGDKVLAVVPVRPILAIAGASFLSGGTAGVSVSSAASHEILEAEADPNCNLWGDNGKGKSIAVEVADPVQDVSYVVSVGGIDVDVSDFVLLPWFDAESTDGGPYDFCRRLDTPFSRTPGGYWAERKATRETEVAGELPPWKVAQRVLARLRAP